MPPRYRLRGSPHAQSLPPPTLVSPLGRRPPRPHPCAQSRIQRASRSNQRQHRRRVLRRIRTPGLRVQRYRHREINHTSEKNKRESLHKHPQSFTESLPLFRIASNGPSLPIPKYPRSPVRRQHHGRVPKVLFFTPTASGVTTGAASPTNCVTLVPCPTLLPSKFALHTLPEPSTANWYGFAIPPPV